MEVDHSWMVTLANCARGTDESGMSDTDDSVHSQDSDCHKSGSNHSMMIHYAGMDGFL